MSKLMIVALAPSRDVAPGTPPLVASPSGRRLANLVGCEPRELPELFELHNLLDRPIPRGTHANPSELKLAWLDLARQIQPGQYVVTLGRDVTHASHFDFAPPYTWMPRHARGAGGCMNQYHQTWAHHTSGRSYFWNDPMNVVQAKQFWNEVGRLGRAAARPGPFGSFAHRGCSFRRSAGIMVDVSNTTTEENTMITMTVTFARGEILFEDPARGAVVYGVVADGPIRGRELCWVETADGRPARVLPAIEYKSYVGA